MFATLKKFMDFCGSENRRKIKTSIILTLFDCIFEAFKIPAAYIMIRAILTDSVSMKVCLECLGIMALGLILAAVVKNKATLLQTEAGYGTCADKRIEIAEHMRYIPMGYFNENSLGQIISASTNTLQSLENIATRVVMNVSTCLLNTAVITLIMLIFDYRIGLILIVGLIIFFSVNRMMLSSSNKMAPVKDKNDAALVEQLVEYIQGITEVKTYNLTGERAAGLNAANREAQHANTAMELKLIPFLTLQTVVIKMIGVAICLFSVIFYLQSSMELSVCIVLIVSAFIVFASLESSSSYSALLRNVEIAVDKVNAIMDTPEMDIDGRDIETGSSTIEAEDISFAYENRKIIENVSFTIPSGTTTAIVGPSGGGKSTIARLAARFWDVNEGTVRLDGRDVKEYSYDSLMKNFSFVFQNVYLFNDTIANNIRFGNPDASMEDVMSAAKKAVCHDFIMALPKGYETVIGDEGVNLSGGERQRISIARAIMKDAPIIILDEATANVDPENEAELMDAIEALTRDKTIIMIAHRLKTVEKADQILVIDKGRIVQQGKHDELMKQDGIYSNFVKKRRTAIGWLLFTAK